MQIYKGKKKSAGSKKAMGVLQREKKLWLRKIAARKN